MLITIQETEPPSKESFKSVPGDTLMNKFNEIRKVAESKDTDRVKESEKKGPPTPEPPGSIRLLHTNEAICDVGATNKHAGLLEGRESLYPKLKQY
jgi:hypothetical protein